VKPEWFRKKDAVQKGRRKEFFGEKNPSQTAEKISANRRPLSAAARPAAR